jgi:DNA-binding transcriptional ArsR family regulator
MTVLRAAGAVALHLDDGDLARVRLSATWGPLSESLLSLRLLRHRRPKPLVGGWQRAVLGKLDRWIDPLLVLAPTSPLIDLHTLVGEWSDLDGALESLATAPLARLAGALQPLQPPAADARGWVRVWLRALSRGEPRARDELADLARRYHQLAIAPYWDRIHFLLDTERAHHRRVMAEGGVDRMLDGLHPRVRWRAPLLEVDTDHTPGWARGRGDRTPGGRSLTLVPSVFCLDGPLLLTGRADRTSPLVLVYPALRGMRDAATLWAPQAPPEPAALARLLGTTRADALHAIASTCTTGDLARRLRVSPATASHHVGVLRDARLVTSCRQGAAVDHRLTPLGAALLPDLAG